MKTQYDFIIYLLSTHWQRWGGGGPQQSPNNTWRHNMAACIIGTDIYINTDSAGTFLHLPLPSSRLQIPPAPTSTPTPRAPL